MIRAPWIWALRPVLGRPMNSPTWVRLIFMTSTTRSPSMIRSSVRRSQSGKATNKRRLDCSTALRPLISPKIGLLTVQSLAYIVARTTGSRFAHTACHSPNKRTTSSRVISRSGLSGHSTPVQGLFRPGQEIDANQVHGAGVVVFYGGRRTWVDPSLVARRPFHQQDRRLRIDGLDVVLLQRHARDSHQLVLERRLARRHAPRAAAGARVGLEINPEEVRRRLRRVFR